MRREDRGRPGEQARVLRLLQLKRMVQIATMGAIVVFLLLSFILPPEIGRVLFPLVILSLAIYTAVSGFVAFDAGITGIGALDGRRGWARGVGILWMFAGCFLAIFGLSYFFS